MTTKLTQAEYIDGLDMLAALAGPLLLFDLAPLLEWLGKAETLAPILESTAYHRGGSRNLDQQRHFLRAVAAFQRALCELQPTQEQR